MKRRKRSWGKRIALFFAKKRLTRFCYNFKTILPKKFQLSRYLMVALVAVVIMANVFMLLNPKMVLGQTYLLTQNDWSGGAAADTVNAPSNQSGWNKYASSTGVTAGAGSITLSANQANFSDTFTTTANDDAVNTTANWNTSTGKIEPASSFATTNLTIWQLSAVFSYGYYITGSVMDPVHNVLYLAGGKASSYGGSCAFAKYDIGTGTVTDLSAAVNSAVADCRSSYSMTPKASFPMVYYQPTGEIFAGTGYTASTNGGRFFKVNTATDAVTDLTAKLQAGFSSPYQYPSEMALDKDNGVLYYAGGPAIGKYAIGSDTVTSLSAGYQTAESMFEVITSIVYSSDDRAVYIATRDHGNSEAGFAKLDTATATFTNLNLVLQGAGWSQSYPYIFLTYDSAHSKIFIYNGLTRYSMRFGTYSASDGVTDLSNSLVGLSILSNAIANIMVYSPSANGIFFGNSAGTGFYSVDSGTTSSFLSADFNGYSLAFDPTGTPYYGNTGTDLLFKQTPPCASCIATSLAIGTTTQNIKSATLTKTDTPGIGMVAYQLSNDGGAHYNTVTPGSLYTFPTTGSDLRFKLILTGNATVSDIAIAYNFYPSSGSLTSSKFDSADAGNIINRLTWAEDASMPAGATATVSIRSAPDSASLTGAWTNLTDASSGCSNAGGTVTCGANAFPSAMQDGSGDRWFQYMVALSSDGRNAPTVSSLSLQFVINAAPEVRNVTAVQNIDGTVTIHYEVRDSDTAGGSPANRDHITPIFQYWDGSAYQTMTSLAVHDTDQKAVAHDGSWNNVTYSATWTPSADFPGQWMNNTAKVRVTANDNEGANPTGSAESAIYSLDTQVPAANSISVDASAAVPTIHLHSEDSSAVTMKVSATDPTLASASPEPYSATKTMSLAEGATVYAQFTDAYNNSTNILSATIPAKPASVMVQDTSNVVAEPHTYRLFIAWKAATGSFASYRIHRSTSLTNPENWDEVGSVGTQATNYFLDSSVVGNGNYYYYVETVDTSGNISYRSLIVNGTADGAQSGGEGGGGIGPAPAITNVSFGAPSSTAATITWDTDTLSDSVVQYSTSPSTFTTAVTVGALVNNDAGVGDHRVIISGLTPNTPYYFRVGSKDIYDQTTMADSGGTGYTFTTPLGPIISNTSVVETTNTTAQITWTTNISASTELDHSTHSDLSAPITTTGTSDPTLTHTVNLTNLNPGTIYFFYVRSVDGSGNATVDNRVVDGQVQYYSFTTTNDQSPPAIAGISVRTQPTSVDIIWTTDKLADSQIEYGLTTAYGTSTILDSTLTTKHVVTVLGLASQTAYDFRIRSRGTNAVLGTSANQTFTTSQAGDATPPVISGTAVASLSLNSASINWTTDEPATSFVDYGATADLGSSAGSPALATSHSVTLDGLTGGAHYYFRVRSADAAGNSSVDNNGGIFYTFTTSADGTAPTISNPDDIISMNSFRVVWSTNELADSMIEYGSDAGYGHSTILDESLVLSHSVAVTSLTAATTYHYRIKTADASGNQTTGPDRVVTTAAQADHTPPIITAPTALNIGRTTATVTWTTDEKSTSEVLYGPNTFYAYNTSKMNDNTTAHSVDLTGLTPGIKYYYKVESADPSGNIATDDDHGAGLTFTTVIDNTPPVISAVSPALVSDVSAVIVWTTDEPATSQVVYGTTTAYGLQTAVTTSLSTVHSVTILGLTAQTPYFYKVVSADAGGNSAADDNNGQSYLFTTTDVPGLVIRTRAPELDTIPPYISNIKVGSIKQASAIVSWQTDENSYSIVKFGIDPAYGSLLGSVDDNVTNHEVALAGLTHGTVYHFMVVSADASGNKAFSDDQVFATLNADGTSPEIPVASTPSANIPAPTNSNTNTPPPAPTESAPAVNNQTGKLQIMNVLKGLLTDPTLPTVPEDVFISTVNEIIDRVVHAPSIVGIAPKVEVTGTTARVSWITDKNANGVVGFYSGDPYSDKEPDPYILSAIDPDTNTTVHEVDIANLQPATTYHYQVRSKGLIGAEAKSADATFVTASELPVITNLSLSNVIDNAATLKWKTNIPTSTSIEYLNAATGETLTQGDTALLQDHSFNVDQLSAGASYKITVVATDEAGDKAESKPITVSTSKDTTPPVISKVSSSSTLYPGKESRVQTIITWDTDEPANSQIFYQEGLATDATVNQLPLDPAMVVHHTAVITKFQPTTVYKFWIQSSDAAGNVAKSKDFLILTPQQQATILDVIIGNFEQVFGWTNKLGK